MKTRVQVKEDRIKLLLENHVDGTPINETIDKIFKDDLQKGRKFVTDRGWRFYVHLNKLPSPMADLGLIKELKLKKGNEKTWNVNKRKAKTWLAGRA